MVATVFESQIYDKLYDNESKAIFLARKNYAENGSLSEFYKNIRGLSYRFAFRDIDQFLLGKFIDKWCVITEGDIGRYHSMMLTDAGFNVILVRDPRQCVNYLSEKGTALLITNDQKDYLPDEIKNNANILCIDNHLVGRYGWQYFDYFAPNKKEVFIDGGALDGATSKDFIKWCGGNHERIYAFEPNPNVLDICRNAFANSCKNNYLLYEKALWRESRQIYFDNSTKSKWDACVREDGNLCIDAISIDEAIGDDIVTFIKLDVEGSEYEALEGAQKCIKQCHPRMAISVYHKEMDYIDLPMLVLKIDPSYRFALRHYHSDAIESVLYAY